MWIKLADEEGPIFFNLNAVQEVRFMTVRSLDKTFVQAHPHLQRKRFGDPGEAILVLIGPSPADFTIVLGVPPGDEQQAIMGYIQNAVTQGLLDGTNLLDMDQLLEQAKARVRGTE